MKSTKAKGRTKHVHTRRSQSVDLTSVQPYLGVLADEICRLMLIKGQFTGKDEFGLSRKQFYARLMVLKEVGLIKKVPGILRDGTFTPGYSRSELGTILAKLLLIVGEIARHSWRFKSLDSVNTAMDTDTYMRRHDGRMRLSNNERTSLKDSLFSDPQLKQIISLIDEASAPLSHLNQRQFEVKGGEIED